MNPKRYTCEGEALVQHAHRWYVVTRFAPHGTARVCEIDPETGARWPVLYSISAAILKAAGQ